MCEKETPLYAKCENGVVFYERYEKKKKIAAVVTQKKLAENLCEKKLMNNRAWYKNE